MKLTQGSLDRIPVPPHTEQAEIVRRVEKLFTYAERLEARYYSASEHVERLNPSLWQRLFAESWWSRVRGISPRRRAELVGRIRKTREEVKVKETGL